MKIEASTIWVTTQRIGFHRWPEPSGKRNYLGARHRHRFGIRLEMPAKVDNAREVEFHDMIDEINEWWSDGEMGEHSCESIASMIAGHFAAKYKRPITATIDEDGEAGATVTVLP